MKEEFIHKAESIAYNFSEDVLVHLEDKGMTKRDLAKVSGIKPRRIKFILKNESKMTLVEAMLISQSLGLPLNVA